MFQKLRLTRLSLTCLGLMVATAFAAGCSPAAEEETDDQGGAATVEQKETCEGKPLGKYNTPEKAFKTGIRITEDQTENNGEYFSGTLKAGETAYVAVTVEDAFTNPLDAKKWSSEALIMAWDGRRSSEAPWDAADKSEPVLEFDLVAFKCKYPGSATLNCWNSKTSTSSESGEGCSGGTWKDVLFDPDCSGSDDTGEAIVRVTRKKLAKDNKCGELTVYGQRGFLPEGG